MRQSQPGKKRSMMFMPSDMEQLLSPKNSDARRMLERTVNTFPIEPVGLDTKDLDTEDEHMRTHDRRCERRDSSLMVGITLPSMG